MVIFHCYVNLPEGTISGTLCQWSDALPRDIFSNMAEENMLDFTDDARKTPRNMVHLDYSISIDYHYGIPFHYLDHLGYFLRHFEMVI